MRIPRQSLFRYTLAIERFAARHQTLLLIVFAIIFLASSVAAASRKPMWFDELCTFLPAILPSWDDLFAFYANGGDVHTPFTSVLVRASINLFGHSVPPEISSRVPAILGYLTACICLFRILIRRTTALYALLAVLILACSRAKYYATEMRPYSLELGIAAFAILCWLEYHDRYRPTWLAGFGLALCTAFLLHPFAIFLWIPFSLAELAKWRELGRMLWRVPAVMAIAAVPALPFLSPIIRAKRLMYQPHWSYPNLVTLFGAYQNYLAIPLAGVCISIAIWVLIRRWVSPPDAEAPLSRPALAPYSEQVLVIVLALVPVFAVAGAQVMHTGVFNERYVLFVLDSIVIATTYFVFLASDGTPLLGVTMVCFFGIQFLGASYRDVRSFTNTPAPGAAVLSPPWIAAAEASQLPVVVQSWTVFPQIQVYGQPSLKSRAYFLTQDRLPDGRIYSDDFSILNIGKPFGWPIADYHEFFKANHHFLFFYDKTTVSLPLTALLPAGATLKAVASNEDGTVLLEVTTP